MDFKIFAAELFNIFPKASLAQTLDLYSVLRLDIVGTADPVAVARDDVVIREYCGRIHHGPGRSHDASL